MNVATSDESNQDRWRRLGIGEEAVDLLERQRGSGHIVRTVALEDVEIDSELLVRARDAIARRHPLLRARIVDSCDGPVFVEGDVREASVRVVAREHDNAWLDVVNDELNATFATGEPLIRLTMVTSRMGARSEIVIACHHSIVDGEAMGMVTRDLLSTYDALSRGQSDRASSFPAPLPAVEDLLGYPLSAAFQSGPLGAFVERQIRLKEEHPFTTFEASNPGITSCRSVIIHRSLPRVVADAVRSRSRAEGASVQAALGAALLAAGRDELLAGESGAFPLVCAVTLRRRLPNLKGDQLGLLSSGVRTAHRVGRTSQFWQLAREVKGSVTDALDREEDVCALLMQRAAVDHYMTRGEAGFAWLTSPGVLDLPHRVAEGRVRASHGAFTMHAVGPAVHSHAATFGDRFTWNFVFPEPALARSDVDAFSRRAMEHLVDACRFEVPASALAEL